MATADDGLAVQDRRALDPAALTPDTPEVISRQATVNIGTIGHVAHGKSTVVKAISGVQTVRFKNELERNITIKLGYANAKIYKAAGKPAGFGAYRSCKSTTADTFEEGGTTWALERHVSFVDCPGHDILMATMLNGGRRVAERERAEAVACLDEARRDGGGDAAERARHSRSLAGRHRPRRKPLASLSSRRGL